MKKLLLIALLIVGCDILQEEDVFGCLDNTALFNANANIASGCEYIVDDCGICGGHSSGTCSSNTKAVLNNKELCESGDGLWTPNCN